MPQTNHLDGSLIREHREVMLAAVRELADGQVSFLIGIRRLAALAGEMRERDPDFDLLIAIESETDHLPNESAKRFCSSEWLRKCEEEEQVVEAFYKTQVAAMCGKLKARLVQLLAQ